MSSNDASVDIKDTTPPSSYRYIRHLDLPDFGRDGQKKLSDANVCIIGAGGLGCPVGLYLGAAGVGHITIIDNDDVELSNLQRQIAFNAKDLGNNKGQALKDRLDSLNSKIDVSAINERLTENNCRTLLTNRTLVLDCTDNFETRYLVNKIAHELKCTLVSGAVVHYTGQVYVFKEGQPCYTCLYPSQPDELTVPVCINAGVLGPVVGVIGTLMAVESIKEIIGLGKTLAGHFLNYDALNCEIQKIKFSSRKDCLVCR